MTDLAWRPVKVRLKDLKPWEDNPRQLSKRAAERLMRSWREFGQMQTVAVGPDGEVYDGHQRLSVLKAAYGDEYEVWALQASRALSNEERRQLVLLIHAGATGAWDWDVLGDWDAELLIESGFDTALQEVLRRDLRAIDELLASRAVSEAPPAREDEAEKLRDKWGTERGQVWRARSVNHEGITHVVACADSSTPEGIGLVMGEGGSEDMANLLVTSPPYWVGMPYETQKTEKEIDEFIDACVDAWVSYVSADYGRIVINTGTSSIHVVEKGRPVERLDLMCKWQHSFRRHGWLLRHVRVWAKTGGMGSGRIPPRADVVDQHWEYIAEFAHEANEPVWVGTFWNPGGRQRGQERVPGAKWAQQGVWLDVHGEASAGGLHVAAFPLEIPERNLRLYTQPGEIVLDPFLGSGTTIMACERMGRNGRGVELSPEYLAVTLERLAQMGLEPERIE